MDIKELAKIYELSGKDFWELKRGNKKMWIITHDACEKIAGIEEIHFEFPEIYVNGEEVALIGKAIKIDTSKGNKEIWSTGEAAPANCKNDYRWAMAEKRLKDRLTLKMINAYEYGIYSEEEADNFKENNNVPAKKEALRDWMGKADYEFFRSAYTLLPPDHVEELKQWLKVKHSQKEIDTQRNAIQVLIDEFHS